MGKKMKDIDVLRAIENGIKMDNSKMRLSLMTKGTYNPCDECDHSHCDYCPAPVACKGIIEMQVFFCPKEGKPCGSSILIKSFYKPTDSGIAEHKYAVCSYNRSGQKPEWCFNTLREAVRAGEDFLVNHGFRILGYVGYDNENKRWSSLRR